MLGPSRTTAFIHTARGGKAVFVPCFGRDEGSHGLRAVEWTRDPDKADTTYVVDYAFLLREGDVVRAAHDHHTEGLFARKTWLGVLTAAGYDATVEESDLGDGMSGEMFVCRKP